MDSLLRLYVRVCRASGQTMTEYALIMAAIAVVAFAAYTTLGTSVTQMVQNVAADL